MPTLTRACALLLLLAGCATVPPPGPSLEKQVADLMERRGIPAETLSQIDRSLRARFPSMPFTPQLARDVLAGPLQAADAAGIFRRSVPETLARFVADASRPRAPAAHTDIRELLEPYLRELAEAQRVL